MIATDHCRTTSSNTAVAPGSDMSRWVSCRGTALTVPHQRLCCGMRRRITSCRSACCDSCVPVPQAAMLAVHAHADAAAVRCECAFRRQIDCPAPGACTALCKAGHPRECCMLGQTTAGNKSRRNAPLRVVCPESPSLCGGAAVQTPSCARNEHSNLDASVARRLREGLRVQQSRPAGCVPADFSPATSREPLQSRHRQQIGHWSRI